MELSGIAVGGLDDAAAPRGGADALRALPAEVVGVVCTYLSARELEQLGTASAGLRPEASAASLWERLYVHDYALMHLGRPGRWLGFADPRDAYISRFSARKRSIAQLRVQEARWAAEAVGERWLRRVEWGLDCLHVRLLTPMFGLAVLTLLIFTALQLDGHIDWSPWEVTAPVWALSGVLLLAIL